MLRRSAITLVVLSLGALFALGCGSNGEAGADAGPRICTASGDCEESQPVTSFEHVEGAIDYTDVPPTSGMHSPCWVAFGEYSTEVPDERWVHNLEHGAVVYLYHCSEGCPAELAALQMLIEGKPFAVLTPYSLLPEPGFAAVSWGHRLVSDTFDLAAFEAFYDAHVDQGRESSSAAPPAACPAP